jgi:hypothetical protein
MTERDYNQLCAICDELLVTPDVTIERIANAWLHVLNEHPSNLAKYSDLIDGLPTERGVALKAALIQLRQWVLGRESGGADTEAASPVDVMFVSHLLNEKQVGAAEDFYFGNAPEALAERGASACVVLKNNTKLAPKGLGARWPAQMARRIVLPDTLCFRQELGLRQKLASEARSLGAGGHTEMDGRVRTEARWQTRSISSLMTLRIYYQILDLVTRLRPKAIVVTFEGHAWERLAFAAARQVMPGVVCVGYHHTILFPRQYAALRPLGWRFDPDVVLTAGTISERRFRAAYASRPVTVATMGIHRRQKEAGGRDPTASGACLVIPDGIISEVVFLFDFVLEAARQAPEIPFVLRLHPMVSRPALLQRYPRFGALPPNVTFSSAGIEEDFERTRCALYRGSNASIYAVIAGLRPFYVAREKEMAIDCLHQMQSWKKVVQTPAEFVVAARADGAQDELERRREAADAVAFCQSYFMPVNLNVLFDILSPALPKRTPGNVK